MMMMMISLERSMLYNYGAIGVARHLSLGELLRPEGPKFESEGRKREGFLERRQQAPSPPVRGSGGAL